MLFLFHSLPLISLQTAYGKTVNNSSLTTIRYNQQKWHPLIPYRNNDTLQKWHATKAPPEIYKHDTHKNIGLEKWHTLRKKIRTGHPIYQGLS